MRGIRWLTVFVVLLLVAVTLLIWRPWITRLTVIKRGGDGPPTMVLLHGYGSSAEHWIPFTQSIPFPPQGRYLLPQAAETTLRTDGAQDGRAWWELDIAAHMRPGGIGIDLIRENPKGLQRAARQVRWMLSAEGNSSYHPFVLGGFSQGAMVACQVAFASDEPLAALVILSGTPVNEANWKAGFARRRGLPVFMSHGRNDDILPYDLADRLRSELEAAGLSVTFVSFAGGHEIPAEVVVALGQFLKQVQLRK